jgi:para-nitrobenzyl esterase
VRRILKAILWAIGAVLVVIVGLEAYVHGRGGNYPSYAAASLPKPSAAAVDVDPAVEAFVQIDSGSLRGTHIGSTLAFRGIPYAKPPVGELRWEPPQPVAPWQGVREAAQAGSACTQRASGLTPFFAPMAKAYASSFDQPPIQSSEDCLYLDVWTQQWPPKGALPVMVWLHGGSNTVGSGTQSSYDGMAFASRGVILVTLNYRLGVLGFFSHPELTAASPHHASGNYGTLDQLAALGWVKRNIAQFGGDPNNVTVFGESAGAIDAGRLAASPLSAGLFKRLISESGPGFQPSRTLAEAEAFGSAVGALASKDAQLTELQRLRALPAEELEKLVVKAREHLPVDITSATTDGWVLPESPQQAYLDGSIQKVDLLVGLNARELSAFRLAAAASSSGGPGAAAPAGGGLKQFSEGARPYFGGMTSPATARYFLNILIHREAGLDQAANDVIGTLPISAMASLTTAIGQRVFVYRFDRVVPGNGAETLGAFHSLEVPYVFGTLHDREWRWLPATPDDDALSGLLQTYWTNFAKSGDPNGTQLPNWPSWSDDRKEFLVINKDASVSAHRNFQPLFSHVSAGELKESFKTR